MLGLRAILGFVQRFYVISQAACLANPPNRQMTAQQNIPCTQFITDTGCSYGD